MTMTLGVLASSVRGSTVPAFVVSQARRRGVAGSHVYTTLPGAVNGDIILIHTSGPFMVTSPPAGVTFLGNSTGGGSSAEASVMGFVYNSGTTPAMLPLSLTFTGSNGSNVSWLTIIRGVKKIRAYSAQSFGNSSSTAPITHSHGFVAVLNSSAAVGLGTPQALGLLHVAASGTTAIPLVTTPVTVSIIEEFDALLDTPPDARHSWLYVTAATPPYTATITPAAFKAGTLVLLDPPIPVADDFNRADGAMGSTSGGAKAWQSVPAGSWTIASNAAFGTHATLDLSATVDTGVTGGDYDVQATYVTTTATLPGGLVLRGSSPSTYLRLFRNGGVWVIMDDSGNGTQTVAHGTNVANGDTLRAAVRGNNISVFLNGVLVATFVSTLYAGGPYMGLHANPGHAVSFDNFSVTTV